MENLCFINGNIVSGAGASLGIADSGLQRGYAVFEYVRTFNNKLFHFKDHLDRLRNSAATLHLELPDTEQKITASATQLINQSKLENPALRIILTGGYA